MTFSLFNLNLPGVLGDLVSGFINGVPNFISAIAIILIGLFVSKLVAKMVRKLLESLKVDTLGEKLNEIDVVAKSNVEIKLSAFFSKIIYYVLVLFFLVMATDVLNMPAVSDLVASIFKFIPNVIAALLFLIIGLLIADFIRNVVLTACTSLGIPSAKLIAGFIFYFLLINVVISALGQAQINTEFLSQNISLVIGGGVLAFAIGYGFASKNVVANYLASFYSKDKIAIGDKITIENVTGTVDHIDKSSFVLKTDSSKIIFPLSKITSEKIEIHH